MTPTASRTNGEPGQHGAPETATPDVRTVRTDRTPSGAAPPAVPLESVACNVCGSTRKETRFTRGDLDLGLDGTFRVVRCQDCGHTYLDPRPTRDAMSRYYPTSYEMHRDTTRADRVGAYRRWRLDFWPHRRCGLLRRYRREGRVLDVGCADGRFLHLLEAGGGFRVTGVEPVAAVAERARTRHGLEVISGTLEDVDRPPGSFDVVTLWDVIEHLHDPHGALVRIAEVLAPGGVLIVSVPVMDCLDHRLFGRYWVGYEIPRHLHFFSTRTLTALLRATGFRVVARHVLHGSDHAFAREMRFFLRGTGFGRPIYEGATLFFGSRLWRWPARPLFWLFDRLRLTTPRAFVCEKEARP